MYLLVALLLAVFGGLLLWSAIADERAADVLRPYLRGGAT